MAINGDQFMAVEWTMVFLMAVLVGSRFYVRYRHGKGLNLCDTFVALAWCSFVFQSSIDTTEYAKGLFRGMIDPSHPEDEYGPEYGRATLEDTQLVLKLLWVQTIMYYLTMYFVKFAMIIFYYELIPSCLPKLRIATHAALMLSIIGITSTVLLKLLYCQPIWTNWAVGGKHCKNLTSVTTDVYRWVFHVVTDIIIYIIPLFLVRQLRILPLSQKIGVAFTFSLGFVCIIFASIVQMTFIVTHDHTVVSFTWATYEMSLSILVVCLPSFKALVNQNMWRRLFRIHHKKRPGVSTTDWTGVRELSFWRRKRRADLEKNNSDSMNSTGNSPSVTATKNDNLTKCASDVDTLPV